MTVTAITSQAGASPTTRPTIVVTGPTRGLGREATLHLAGLGTRLILMGRPSASFDSVARECAEAGAEVRSISVDFASLASVRNGVAATAHVDGGIDAVIANAGLQMTDRVHATVDGFETTFAVNVLANHLLVRGLQPAMRPSAHVVVVGSGTHYGKLPATLLVAPPRWTTAGQLARPGTSSETNARAGQAAYSTSKLAVNYLVNEFQRREVNGVRYNVFDPGLMPGTGLARDMPAYKQWLWNNVMPRMTFIPGTSTPAQSGRLLARMAIGLDHSDLRGGYVEIGHVSRASDASFDPAREADLWSTCEALTKP